MEMTRRPLGPIIHGNMRRCFALGQVSDPLEMLEHCQHLQRLVQPSRAHWVFHFHLACVVSSDVLR